MTDKCLNALRKIAAGSSQPSQLAQSPEQLRQLIKDPVAKKKFLDDTFKSIKESQRKIEQTLKAPVSGQALYNRWWQTYPQDRERIAQQNPELEKWRARHAQQAPQAPAAAPATNGKAVGSARASVDKIVGAHAKQPSAVGAVSGGMNVRTAELQGQKPNIMDDPRFLARIKNAWRDYQRRLPAVSQNQAPVTPGNSTPSGERDIDGSSKIADFLEENGYRANRESSGDQPPPPRDNPGKQPSAGNKPGNDTSDLDGFLRRWWESRQPSPSTDPGFYLGEDYPRGRRYQWPGNIRFPRGINDYPSLRLYDPRSIQTDNQWWRYPFGRNIPFNQHLAQF